MGLYFRAKNSIIQLRAKNHSAVCKTPSPPPWSSEESRNNIYEIQLFKTIIFIYICTRGVANIQIYKYPRIIGQISRIIFVSANRIFIHIFVLSADTNYLRIVLSADNSYPRIARIFV